MKQRWFKVVARSFDVKLAARSFKSYKEGQYGFERADVVKKGIEDGKIVGCTRPKGLKVGKDGVVRREVLSE